jgi:hypothetical protein
VTPFILVTKKVQPDDKPSSLEQSLDAMRELCKTKVGDQTSQANPSNIAWSYDMRLCFLRTHELRFMKISKSIGVLAQLEVQRRWQE